MNIRPWMLVALTACGGLDPQEGVALEGFRYGWAVFNHRLSTLDLALRPNAAQVAVVGGTSTTGVAPPPLAGTCDPEQCQEFPFADGSDVRIDWAKLTSDETLIATASASLTVDRDGGQAVATFSIPRAAKGEAATAWISGIHLATDQPLAEGDACYNPAYGWHPRRIAVALGAVQEQDDTMAVDVLASFEAGESLEPERACVDAVNEQAVVDLTVDVLLVYGTGQTATQDVLQSGAYAYDGKGLPDVQKEPTAVPVDFGFTPTAAGFTALDFAFHVDDPDNRGAYLRTLAFSVDPVGGTANGTATNYSPGTQLSGFDFAFTGTVSAVDFPLTVERGTIMEALDTELDDAGAPVVHSLPY